MSNHAVYGSFDCLVALQMKLYRFKYHQEIIRELPYVTSAVVYILQYRLRSKPLYHVSISKQERIVCTYTHAAHSLALHELQIYASPTDLPSPKQASKQTSPSPTSSPSPFRLRHQPLSQKLPILHLLRPHEFRLLLRLLPTKRQQRRHRSDLPTP